MKRLFKISVVVLLLLPNLSDSAGNLQGCTLGRITGDNPGYYKDGDVIVGGIMQFFYAHSRSEEECLYKGPQEPVCQDVFLPYLYHYLAFDFAIKEINENPEILPNITLGYDINDACTFHGAAIHLTLRVLSGGVKHYLNYSCKRGVGVVAFIGHLLSSMSQSVASILSLYGHPQLNKYMRNLRFRMTSGNNVVFNGSGLSNVHLDLLNFVTLPNKKVKAIHVGEYISDSHGQNKLIIKRDKIIWNSHFLKAPESSCSEKCPHGFRKSAQGLKPCCHVCIQCSPGMISNAGFDSCVACPEDEWPDVKAVNCVKRPIHLLSFQDELGATLISFAIVFFMISTFILVTFLKFRETPIVKANNRNLSYITLLSLMMSFLCSMFFFGVPVDLTCLLQNFTYNMLFAVSISSVLAKNITVLVAFNITKKSMTILTFLVSPKLCWFVILIILMGELGICLFWFVLYPPFPEQDSVSRPGILILHCNIGSPVMFYLDLGYKSFIALLCFVVAFLAKKLPDQFNEAQHITISMLVCFCVWVAFIPAYISTKGKYMIAVRVFAILASSFGILGSIFFPKCYTIILKPQRNVRESRFVRQ